MREEQPENGNRDERPGREEPGRTGPGREGAGRPRPGDGDADRADHGRPPAGAAGRGGADAGAEQADRERDDAVFAELIAAFDDPVDLTEHHWPAAEDVPPGGGTPGLPTVTDLPDLADFAEFAPKPRPRGHVLGPRDWEFAEDLEDDHFTPPEPPAVPHVDPATRLAWAAVVGAPVLILVLALTGQSVGGLWAVLASVMFLGGSAALVTRLKADRDDEDDDPQHGAVV